MQDIYKENLAYIHDAGFDHLAKGAAPLLLKVLQHSGMDKGKFVDIGCGSGITCRLLRDAGFDVIGIDLSPSLLKIAQNRVPDGEFYLDSFITFDIPSCSAVAAIGEVLNYTFDEENDPLQRGHFFRRVYEALEPGGCFLFDVAGPERIPSEGSVKTFSTNTDWTVLMEADVNSSNNILSRHITTFCRKSKLYERDVEVHRLQLIDGTEVKEALQQIGFSVQTLDSYDRNPLPRGVEGFLAMKEKLN